MSRPQARVARIAATSPLGQPHLASRSSLPRRRVGVRWASAEGMRPLPTYPVHAVDTTDLAQPSRWAAAEINAEMNEAEGEPVTTVTIAGPGLSRFLDGLPG